jgi:aminomethyltransferase
MVDFAGYSMPVAYGSIIAEHRTVRERAGIFDVSHMGEFVVKGARAAAFINEVITNDCSKLTPGELQYTAMCREDGTVVDDLLVYHVEDGRFILVVNASNIEKDFAHIASFDQSGVEITNASDDYALLAVQGPRSRDIMQHCPFFAAVATEIAAVEYYKGIRFVYDEAEVLISRTGYTGELGFEIFVPPGMAVPLWAAIMEASDSAGIEPIGLGARDTLRFEASYALYGHELDDRTSPLEAGLGWVVKLKKENFRGIDALRSQKKVGPPRMLVGFELNGRSIARQGYTVRKDGRDVGKVTSGAFAPTLEKSLCMALVDHDAVGDGEYELEIRNRLATATPTPLPFYKSRAK